MRRKISSTKSDGPQEFELKFANNAIEQFLSMVQKNKRKFFEPDNCYCRDMDNGLRV